jgi:superfamily II DNA or RNA helicase
MITLSLDSQTHLSPFSYLPDRLAEEIIRKLTLANPAYQSAVNRGRYTGGIAPEIHGYQIDGDQLIIPRGFSGQLGKALLSAGVRPGVEDCRRALPEVDFHFLGELRDFQEEAVKAMAREDFGTLAAPTGSGKTIMGLYLIAQRKQPTLIVVHTKELLKQWVDRIETFLGIPASEVGIIGNGEKRIGNEITVALVQSLYKCVSEVVPHIGNLVIDECHRAPSRTFTECVKAFDSRYMTGLSATPWRRDGLSKLIFWYVGDVAHKVDEAALVEAGYVLRAEVIWRDTAFETYYNQSTEYSKMLSELTMDPDRNALIAQDVAKEARIGMGVCLVLSDRKAHCEVLAGLLESQGVGAEVLTGDLGNSERQAVVEALKGGQVKVLVATGQLIGEGFDCQELSTLFLATPITFSGRLLQYLGRVLRPAPGKDKAKVYDYRDPVGVLECAARGRARVYGV